jgi:serine/threonine-protein kinase HipA
MSPDRLVVRHFGRDVGTITRTPSGALSFEYAPSWLAEGAGFPLATSLPLTEGAHETSFFRNLLPEAGARERIAGSAGISPDNDFAFLRIFGADCAGSLEITYPGEESQAIAGPGFLPLAAEDGARLATKEGFAGLFVPENRIRLSLAGAQNKLAVIETDDGLAVPLDGRPSTHILKLPNPDYRGLVENEALILSLAAAVGLPVVDHEVVTLGETRLLLVTRYDRVTADGQVIRLHQQDLCQATGLPPDTKYEGEGGPSLPTVLDLVREEVADPLTAAKTVLDWVVFNVLVHNADAHAKNISILRTQKGQHVLAPFYDLVCTGAYPLDHRLAMSVGGQFDPGAVNKNNWVQMASDIGIGKSLVLRNVETMAGRILEVLDGEVKKLRDRLGRVPRREQLERTIRRSVKKTLELSFIP